MFVLIDNSSVFSLCAPESNAVPPGAGALDAGGPRASGRGGAATGRHHGQRPGDDGHHQGQGSYYGQGEGFFLLVLLYFFSIYI